MSTVRLLAETVTRRFGLAWRPSWSTDIPRALGLMGQRLGLSASAVVDRVLLDPELLDSLAGMLTIGETYFFRHPTHFEVLTQHVGRTLAARVAGERVVVWSAGCASGEEAYSVAIAIDAVLGAEALARTSIEATDLHADAIGRARLAIYGAWSFRGSPPWFLGRYFTARRSGGGTLVPRIRDAVGFLRGDLLLRAAGLPSHSIDVIFFRNVAIYLAPDALRRLYEEFARTLTRDGVLVTAAADPTPPGHLLARAAGPGETIYRPARSGGLAVAASRPSPPPQASRPSPPQASRLPPAPPAAPSAAPAWHGAPWRDRLAEALRMGNRGELVEGIAVASALVDAAPAAAAGYLMRGRLQLAAGFAAPAAEDLRRAVFLAPGDAVARFWYAHALRSEGGTKACLRQLEELERLLARRGTDEVLDDEQTRAGDLVDAGRALRQEMT